MATFYSIQGGSGANLWLLTLYRPTRIHSITIRPLYGLDFATPRVTVGKDPLQREQSDNLTIDLQTLRGGVDGAIELLIPRVRREDAEQGGPPPFFNIWVRVWSMGKDTVHVRVDSDQSGSRATVGWVSFLAHGARWLTETDGHVLIQQNVQPTSKVATLLR